MVWPVRKAGHKLYFIRPHDGQHRFVVLWTLPRRRRDCCVLRLIAPLSFIKFEITCGISFRTASINCDVFFQVEPYNTVLCVHSLLEHTDVTVMIWTSSGHLCTTFALPYLCVSIGAAHVDVTEFQTNLVPCAFISRFAVLVCSSRTWESTRVKRVTRDWLGR